VHEDQILFVLDGLDEVPEEHRRVCVGKINEYCEHHASPPLVVSSRTDSHDALPIKPNLVETVQSRSLSRTFLSTSLPQYDRMQ